MQVKQYGWQPDTGWNAPWDESLSAAQLILVFGSPAIFQAPTWQTDLSTHYPHAKILGCSTAGEILQTQVWEDGLVATVIQFEHTQIKGFSIQQQPGEDSFAAGKRLGEQIEPDGLVHVFMLSDGLQVNGSELVRGLVHQLPPHISVTGGLAGDGDRFQETCVLWEGTPTTGRIAALGLYGDRLHVGYGSFGGWQTFGSERRVTKSQANVLYELDGEPALALYKKYLGHHAAELPASGLLFPLNLQIADSDRSVVRTILAVNEAEQSLTFAGDIPQGSMVQLMQASFERLVEGAIQAAVISLEPLDGEHPDLAILISCVGRKLLLNQRIEEEVEGVQDVLGDRTVLAGFYSYGEISPLAPGSPCELHNQTMTITTLRES